MARLVIREVIEHHLPLKERKYYFSEIFLEALDVFIPTYLSFTWK